jgi:XTP/dITP diphosphohydrolase
LKTNAVLVSRNPGKLRELQRLLPEWSLRPLDTTGIGEEAGDTFEANARAKAEWGRMRSAPTDWVIGEDSGLEVGALGGAPGIRSARFAGPNATDDQNVDRLLADLAGDSWQSRAARYVCAIVAIDPDGATYVAHGHLEGSIARRRTGSAGFGYDPVFIPSGATTTVAELGEQWKSTRSHRARAVSALLSAVSA